MSDILQAALDPSASAPAQPRTALQRLSNRHHKLARLLAQGFAEGKAAVVCNYSPARVSSLKHDVSFSALVEHYKGETAEAMQDFRDQLKDAGVDALMELQYRLENDPEAISNKMLVEMVKMVADRTGYAVQTKHEHEHSHEHSFARQIEIARKNAPKMLSENVLEAETDG